MQNAAEHGVQSAFRRWRQFPSRLWQNVYRAAVNIFSREFFQFLLRLSRSCLWQTHKLSISNNECHCKRKCELQTCNLLLVFFLLEMNLIFNCISVGMSIDRSRETRSFLARSIDAIFADRSRSCVRRISSILPRQLPSSEKKLIPLEISIKKKSSSSLPPCGKVRQWWPRPIVRYIDFFVGGISRYRGE